MCRARALGLALGFAADRLIGDPARRHPVAGFGRVAAATERVTYRDSRAAGLGTELLLVGGALGLGGLVSRAASRRGAAWLEVATTAAATWAVLGGTGLAKEAKAVEEVLQTGDLEGARRQVARIVGRDTRALTDAEIARATVETVAENTSDAVVAPLLWGAIAGTPGLLGYRAINTLDAMFGHKSPRYLRFGWAAARIDDLANWLPARATAVLVAVARPARAAAVRTVVSRDAAQHPSPNAGVVESAFAGALELRLGGANTYHDLVEERGALGDGAPPTTRDIGRAVALSKAVGWLAALAAAGVAAGRARRSQRA